MIKSIIATFFFAIIFSTVPAQEKLLTKGMKITSSIKIKKRSYLFDGLDDLAKPVIIIEGKNIIIDFNNATLKGSNKKGEPDDFFGTGIIIRNSENVTIKNLKVLGYKVALLARNVEKLTLENCDFSYNYRQYLNSTQEKEDISDWMSYHHNENDEWLRYGAAVYLRKCDYAEIKNCKVTDGQNALMMAECNYGLIYNNDFSFNSGIGIGMYKSSNNKVLYNKINFNVRGYSHAVYNRGQDSAGILVYEQSNNNIFYSNSVTHGGDGFFLWAGQTTMESGQGGCNDNMLVKNDFSFAPTNGVEVTFSRNVIRDNRIYECDHGIWGGYSFNTSIAGNKFRNNRIAIAIEHGQDNQINYNLFSEDKEAIKLWARKEQPADWGYAKNRDTRSRDYEIKYNSFNRHNTVFNLNRTENILITSNTYGNSDVIYKIDSTVINIDSTIVNDDDFFPGDKKLQEAIKQIAKPNDPFSGNGKFAGRKNIRVTEWGPYDFRYPIIWNTNPTDTSGEMKFEILGPAGKWKIKSVKGVEKISLMNGILPATISAWKKKTVGTDIKIELEYTGESFTTQFGQTVAVGKPYIFSFKKYLKPINWEVFWFAADTTSYNPIKTGNLFPPYVKMRPVKKEQVNKLDYAWWGGIKDDETKEQYKQFITTATAKADFEKGEYELSITWDDAVRIYVDTNLLVNEWNPSLYKFDESPNKKIKLKLEGTHFLRVEHIELGGFATLQLKFKKLD
jgi:parallel beta-helix repeat protein